MSASGGGKSLGKGDCRRNQVHRRVPVIRAERLAPISDRVEGLDFVGLDLPPRGVLPQKCHSEERRRPTKNLFTSQQVSPPAKRPLATLGVTGGVILGAIQEANKIAFDARLRGGGRGQLSPFRGRARILQSDLDRVPALDKT